MIAPNLGNTLYTRYTHLQGSTYWVQSGLHQSLTNKKRYLSFLPPKCHTKKYVQMIISQLNRWSIEITMINPCFQRVCPSSNPTQQSPFLDLRLFDVWKQTKNTLPETNKIAPENRPSQNEIIIFHLIPTIHFQGPNCC